MLHKYEKITDFDGQTALFNGASVEKSYIRIYWGSPIELAPPVGAVTFTRLCKASTGYYALFRLLKASAVQKV